MNSAGYGQSMPSLPPVEKPRNKVAVVALGLALLALAVTALGIWFVVASHAWTNGCRIDEPLHNAGALACLPVGCLLSLGAAVTGLVSCGKRGARGAYRAIGVIAIVLGTLGLIVSLFLFSAEIRPHAMDPAYLHPC